MKFNKRGLTLIELLVSIFIALVVFGGLYEALMIYTRYNVLTSLRNQAVSIAQSCLNTWRSGGQCPTFESIRYRNYNVTFNIKVDNRTLSVQNYNNITVIVTYKYGGKDYSYSVSTVVYRQ